MSNKDFRRCLSAVRWRMKKRTSEEGVTCGSPHLQRSKSWPVTFVLCAVSCSALIKLRKHHNREASSAHINPASYIPPFVICVIPHIIPLKPYHITGSPPPPSHLMTLKASLRQISTNDEQECVRLP